MTYEQHYKQFILKYGRESKPEDGTRYDRHHILPRALGGSNEDNNLVYLTPREHFIAHWFLWKIHRSRPTALPLTLMSSYGSYAKCSKSLKTRIAKEHGLRPAVVTTPQGVFNGFNTAAEALGVPASTLMDWARSGKEGYSYELCTSRAALGEEQHGMARRVQTPNGSFGSVGLAAKAYGVTRRTIGRYTERADSGFFYLEPPKQARTGQVSKYRKQVETPLGVFSSISEAAIAHGCERATIRRKYLTNSTSA